MGVEYLPADELAYLPIPPSAQLTSFLLPN